MNSDKDNSDDIEYIPEVEVYLDNELMETAHLPTSFTTRRHEICWKYNLKNEKHSVKIKLINPKKGYTIRLYHATIYGDALVNSAK